MELPKWLHDSNRRCFPHRLNDWWVQREAPKELFIARVMLLYKNGDTDNAANSKPISVFSSATVFEIHLMMITDSDSAENAKRHR